MQALEEKRELALVLSSNEAVARNFSREEIGALLDPHKYIGTAVDQVEKLEGKLRPLLK
jgi:adenylosuccinate lyase